MKISVETQGCVIVLPNEIFVKTEGCVTILPNENMCRNSRLCNCPSLPFILSQGKVNFCPTEKRIKAFPVSIVLFSLITCIIFSLGFGTDHKEFKNDTTIIDEIRRRLYTK